ncbi:serine/threonine-protein kinase [Streptomyces sp. TP-A0356]|uniref:serine/threonine-protein kinase n=1 Tax=Streptomyces sp. TP-A0356 TaxID=1359208 RepID=UPI0006E2E86D|nr:serine/threonine-protein kinase [Streptomyces sp. TP-A0356]
MSTTLLAGRYRLVRRLGSGAQGTVHEAWDENLERRVAVKTLALPASGGVTYRAMMHGRFGREARALARLVHPHVVTIHDRGEQDGTPYIVMEFLVGRSLAAELEARGPLPVDEVLRQAGQIAQGLEAVHDAGIAHRDIKPSNLLLTTGQQVKICDFGLVTQVSPHSPGFTVRGGVLGSPGYMSPEQAAGQPGDPRSDIFSFGVTLYALLAGASPFAARDPAVAAAHALGDPPEPVTHWRSDLPAAVAALIGRMLERAPERRPEIQEVRSALGSSARPTTWALGGAARGAGEPAAVVAGQRGGAADQRQGSAPARRPAAAAAGRLAERERLIPTRVPDVPGRSGGQPGRNHPRPDPPPRQGGTSGAQVAPLSERFWPGLEDAERLLVNKEFAEAEKSFAQLCAELTALNASTHPAFFAALFGRARALDAMGRHITARNRLVRLDGRIGAALGTDHQLALAVARYLRGTDDGTRSPARSQGPI